MTMHILAHAKVTLRRINEVVRVWIPCTDKLLDRHGDDGRA